MEQRLIDANALKRRLLPIKIALAEEYGSLGGAVSGCMKHIDNAPTVDAVPVVRCRDCKHSDAECHKDGLRYCMRGIRADDYNETGYVYPLEVDIRDDDFCSYGERKEGADDGTD